jgi:hypothetical protein
VKGTLYRRYSYGKHNDNEKPQDEDIRITPPRLYSVQPNSPVLRELQAEEDQHGANCHARIECSGEHIVVFRPPREVAPANDVLEDEPDDGPGDVIDGTGGGDGASSGEDDGEAGGVIKQRCQ